MNCTNALRLVLFLAGVSLLSNSFYINLKAELAQYLISSSWQTHQSNQPARKPWPWADTYAIAKIEVHRLELVLYVMNDDTGESLAFGPGHIPQSAIPASNGHSMIAGHRDSHFDFIQHLKIGDKIVISNYLGKRQEYEIDHAYKMDVRVNSLIHYADENLLTLITCFPFNGLTPGGPLRWVVNASPVDKYHFGMVDASIIASTFNSSIEKDELTSINPGINEINFW